MGEEALRASRRVKKALVSLIQERYRRGFYFRDRPLTPYVLEFARLSRFLVKFGRAAGAAARVCVPVGIRRDMLVSVLLLNCELQLEPQLCHQARLNRAVVQNLRAISVR
jgi:hypothetical protein